MIERRDDDLLLIVLVAALLRDGGDEDPFVGDMVYRALRRQGRLQESLDPELDHLLERALRSPRRPRRLEEMRQIANATLDGFRSSFQEGVEQRLGELSSKVDSLVKFQAEMTTTTARVEGDQQATKDTLHSFLWLLSSGANITKARVTRYVPVRLYFSDPVPDERTRETIISAIVDLVEPAGFERSYELPEESGSWWKRFVLRTKGFFTQEEVRSRLQIAERALEVTYLDKPQAEANNLQAQAAAGLICALNSTPNACIQVGTLLLVKATDTEGRSALVARTLTVDELRMIEENQAILRKPGEILEYLQTPMRRLI